MIASELKKKAFESISGEIKDVEALMLKEANKGGLQLTIESLSAAAKLYLQNNGFEVKILIEPGVEVGGSRKSVISWGK